MSRYPHNQDYRNGRSRRNGQQHGHGRGEGYNAHHTHDEHVALSQQSGHVQAVSHHRMQLNNYLQHRFRSTRDLHISESTTGPGHALWWTVVVLFRNVEYGRGEGVTKASATELACQSALNALMQPGIGH
ncbi:hypothetical protein DFH29DRAFT_871553 [Suillus ampliporus]|nr:hypothetical protein DFH29DRAFT_871553 [Suillus ampliporus]